MSTAQFDPTNFNPDDLAKEADGRKKTEQIARIRRRMGDGYLAIKNAVAALDGNQNGLEEFAVAFAEVTREFVKNPKAFAARMKASAHSDNSAQARPTAQSASVPTNSRFVLDSIADAIVLLDRHRNNYLAGALLELFDRMVHDTLGPDAQQSGLRDWQLVSDSRHSMQIPAILFTALEKNDTLWKAVEIIRGLRTLLTNLVNAEHGKSDPTIGTPIFKTDTREHVQRQLEEFDRLLRAIPNPTGRSTIALGAGSSGNTGSDPNGTATGAPGQITGSLGN